MKIYFVTENQGKLWEAKQVLSPYDVEVIAHPLSIWEPGEGTVEEIALHKLQQALKQQVPTPFMVDDAGIEFAAFPGFPGPISKRVFSGIGYRGLQNLLQGEERKATFRGCVALYWQGMTPSFVGETSGLILEDIPQRWQAEPGFPYDPVFIPDGESLPLRELPQEKRLFHSYRRKALEEMMSWIQQDR